MMMTSLVYTSKQSEADKEVFLSVKNWNTLKDSQNDFFGRRNSSSLMWV